MTAGLGAPPIVADIQTVGDAFSEGVGLSTVTAAANIGMSALGAFLDPIAWVVGQLMEPIYNWICDNVQFVKDALNLLLGNPDAVHAVGECVTAMGDQVESEAQSAYSTMMGLLNHWTGPAADAFKVAVTAIYMAELAQAAVLRGCGGAIKVVAGVVDMVKQFIIGLGKEGINQLISKGVMSVLASFVTFGAAFAAYTAWAAGKVASLFAKVSGLLRKLAKFGADNTTQFSKLSGLLRKAEGIFAKLEMGFLRQVHLADQAAGHAQSAQHQAGQADGMNSAAQHAGSDAPGYNQGAADATASAQQHTQQSHDTRPDPLGPTAPNAVDAANSAASNAEDREQP
ncbi:hypothetical protein [Aestuariimicrobium sp. Y1814]|uniref:hypothetical protein n=1 Tax=Aestuariimicrobium sp. Y1814 TaxID=3418742 RepID=UPI003DA7A6AB